MRLAEKHIIKPTHKYYQVLVDELHKSKNLYNAALYALRQEYFASESYIPYARLQHQFQEDKNIDYYSLPSKIAQWTMKMVDQNYKSFFNAIKEYKRNPQKFEGRPKIPNYLEKDGLYLLTYTNQAISKKELQENQVIKLSGIDVRINTKIKYENLCNVRVVPRLDYVVVEVIYEVEDVPIRKGDRTAAIDLGVDNLAAVVTNIPYFKPFAVSGKELKSYNHYYNKKKAKLKSIAETINKVGTSKQLKQLERKRTNKINDFLHKASRYIVNQLVSSDVTTLIIGNNKQWKQDINNGKVNNQNFVEIPHSKLVNMLIYKCRLVGIEVFLQEESYTSKCSFLDMEEVKKHDKYKGRRVHRGLFKASDGRFINADVNGAFNIMRKCKPKAMSNGVMGVVVHPRIVKILN